ncbi:Polymeric immunoglobulin receptor [Sigmodon hispidus]
MVKLFQLSPNDTGLYRCGIGDRNDRMFFKMNLIVSAGPSNTTYAAAPASGELITASPERASAAANRWTPEVTKVLESRSSEWDRTALTTRISKTTASGNERQTLNTARTTVPGTSRREEGSLRATVPTPESPASKSRSMFSTTQDVWIWGTGNSVTTSPSTSESEGKDTTPEADGPQEETEGAPTKTTRTTQPSVLISEHVTWETLQEAMEVSKQQKLYYVEESSPAPSAQTLNTTHMQVVSGSIDRGLENTSGESSPPTPSQLSSKAPLWAPGKGSSMKSAFTEGESNSWILTPASTALTLVLLSVLVLLKRRLWRERPLKEAQEAERPPRITLIQMTHFPPDKLVVHTGTEVYAVETKEDPPSAAANVAPKWGSTKVFPTRLVSTKSPIFGPQDVSSVVGNSVSITCYYPDTSVNRHTRKYWCRQGASGLCTTLISSQGFVSKEYAGRASIINFPGNNTFVINIAQLTQSDTGSYKCGLGTSNQGLFFDVSLEVSQVPELPADTHVYTKDLGRNVIIDCPFKLENAHSKKSLCKKTGQTCELVIDSVEYVNPKYKDRIKLFTKGTSKEKFSVNITNLRLSDAGLYVCQAGEDPKADKKNVDLQVLKPEPELVYGDLRASVTFDCALGREVANEAKYLCRMNKDKCDVVINTLGKRDPSFEGRILLTPKDKNGRFSILITGLRREDAGYYLCGAHSSGLPQEGWPIQSWHLFVNEESTIPNSRSVVKGVTGGSVAITCPYNPKDNNSLKYWCHWDENGHCPILVDSQGLKEEQYVGRLALYDQPGNGIYTVILNQLTTKDAGFYWCLTNGDSRWRTTIELQVAEATGKPNLEVTPQNVNAVLGESVEISCHYPCKFYSHEKYWCKWSSQGCHVLPSQDKGARQPSVSCDQNNQVISITLNPVKKEDEGWYWCGVKQGQVYGETTAIYVAVGERTGGSRQVIPPEANAAPQEEAVPANVVPEEKAVDSSVIENKNIVVLYPKLPAEEKGVGSAGDQVQENRASVDAGSANGQNKSSTVLFSTLVPLGLLLSVGAVAVWVARVRHRKNVDRMSISSYRTDISMSDFKNSRDLGGNDNMGVSTDTQETVLERKDEIVTTTEIAIAPEESKKAKRSSKEEADLAYSAFLLQSSNIAAQVHDGPKEV